MQYSVNLSAVRPGLYAAGPVNRNSVALSKTRRKLDATGPADLINNTETSVGTVQPEASPIDSEETEASSVDQTIACVASVY